MTPEKAREQANNIMEMFWHNFLKSEPAFVMRDVIAIALENADNKTELPREEPAPDEIFPAPAKPIVTRTADERGGWHYDSQGYCDNPGRGY
jgi:hypothetical protein